MKKIEEYELKYKIKELFWQYLDINDFDDIDFGEPFDFLGGNEKDFLEIINSVQKKYKLNLEIEKNLIREPMILIINEIWNKFKIKYVS